MFADGAGGAAGTKRAAGAWGATGPKRGGKDVLEVTAAALTSVVEREAPLMLPILLLRFVGFLVCREDEQHSAAARPQRQYI